MRIAVAGGTGTVGRYVVKSARARGHDVVVLARSNNVNLQTGDGLSSALDGVDAVIDVANQLSTSAAKARSWFEAVSANLLREEKVVHVAHHVALSIVGIDDIDASYYAGKLAQERIVRAGEVPYTIVRAAQFHEFAGQMLAQVPGPLALMPKMLIRPVAAREVAEHLVLIAEGPAQSRSADLVGPRDETLADLARRQLAHDGIRRRVIEARLPGVYGRGLASGALRGTRKSLEAAVTFDQWLGGDHLLKE